MKKCFIFLVIAVFLISGFGMSPRAEAERDQTPRTNPTATPNDLPSIEKIELDKKEVTASLLKEDEGKESLRVKVETTVRNPKNLPIIYEYTVSGGRIVGQGDKVFWDLKGVAPGTYTITVTIDYGRGFINETKSETVEVKRNENDHSCICQTVAASGGGNIKAGENVTFSADVSGGSASERTYNWTISQGEIIEGQGTARIMVRTTKEMSGIIEATVEVSAPGLCEACSTVTDSETATIIK